MAYNIMKSLIAGYKAGKSRFTKARLITMCNVYYGAGQLEDPEYAELMEELSALEEKTA